VNVPSTVPGHDGVAEGDAAVAARPTQAAVFTTGVVPADGAVGHRDETDDPDASADAVGPGSAVAADGGVVQRRCAAQEQASADKVDGVTVEGAVRHRQRAAAKQTASYGSRVVADSAVRHRQRAVVMQSTALAGVAPGDRQPRERRRLAGVDAEDAEPGRGGVPRDPHPGGRSGDRDVAVDGELARGQRDGSPSRVEVDDVGSGVSRLVVGGRDRGPQRAGTAVESVEDGERGRHRAVFERLNPQPDSGLRPADRAGGGAGERVAESGTHRHGKLLKRDGTGPKLFAQRANGVEGRGVTPAPRRAPAPRHSVRTASALSAASRRR